MPQFLSLVEDGAEGSSVGTAEEMKSGSSMQSPRHNGWRGLFPPRFNFFRKEEDTHPRDAENRAQSQEDQQPPQATSSQERPGLVPRRLSRKVVPGLPRPQTFTRQNSERRERLFPVEPCAEERRAVSVDRKTNLTTKRTRSPPPVSIASLSAPEVGSPEAGASTLSFVPEQTPQQSGEHIDRNEDEPLGDPPPEPPPIANPEPFSEHDDLSDGADDNIIQEELDSRWILNLSMHFRDKSDREKFFVTYAAEPNRWERVTVSCDYRDALPDSLEADLKSLHYQRDKSDRIYESIRDSLPGIQFYPSVTNLKLQTEDNRLHVHVTEDVNEIINYPPISAVKHLNCPHFREEVVHFDAHLSGFVYKVEIYGRSMIKKEIPGPDTVDEFLYEVNALNSLSDSLNVIRLEGIVVSNDGNFVKGLVISVAERGALVDLLYDEKGCIPWARRERWAHQVVRGLNEIHESGFVQGDFTLSNVVIDKYDDAKIIDINRRGCPVGWEPPELATLIENGQRISMHIGVKTDIFQLGMVLWAIARGEDEPERQEKPLGFDEGAHEGTPKYFQDIVRSCLSKRPQDRLSAKELLKRFPSISEDAAVLDAGAQSTSTAHRSDKEYIDPESAVRLEDIEAFRHRQRGSGRSDYSTEDVTYADADPSTDYRFDSSGSCIVGRGRSNVSSARRRNDSPYARPVSSTSSGSEQVMHRYEHAESAGSRWEKVDVPEEAFEVHAPEGAKEKHEEVLTSGPKVAVLERSPLRGPLRVRNANESPSPLRHKKDETDLKASARSASDPTGSFPPPLHQDSGLGDMVDTADAFPSNPPILSIPSYGSGILNSSPSTLTPDTARFMTPRTEIRVPTNPMPPEKSISPSPQRGRPTQPRRLNSTTDDCTTTAPG
ncbi:MAG: hypothetical protein M1822_004967 [Bathelium mastoideum]|nr:MAG: hypothetical protein M1822_004967 [Bathelium mastoideum]